MSVNRIKYLANEWLNEYCPLAMSRGSWYNDFSCYICSFLCFSKGGMDKFASRGVERAVINLILNLGIRIISAAINSHFNPWRSKSRNDENGDTRVSVYRRKPTSTVLINYTPCFTWNLKNTNVLNFVRANRICFNKLLQLRWLRELSVFVFFQERKKLIWNLQFFFFFW